jgi:hypothetical protein
LIVEGIWNNHNRGTMISSVPATVSTVMVAGFMIMSSTVVLSFQFIRHGVSPSSITLYVHLPNRLLTTRKIGVSLQMPPLLKTMLDNLFVLN